MSNIARICSVENCDRPSRSKLGGHCNAHRLHYQRYERGTKPCSNVRCSTLATRKGMCYRHYSRFTQGLSEISVRDPNDIIVDGDIAYIILVAHGSIETGRAVIDAADVPLVKPYKWNIDSGYVSHSYRDEDGKKHKLYLHRLLGPSAPRVDHEDTNPFNNRRSNLRAATHGQNMQNVGLRANNKSGHKNVRLLEDGRWLVEAMADGKKYYAGVHSSLEKAIETRNGLLLRIHGEFARAE